MVEVISIWESPTWVELSVNAECTAYSNGDLI